MANLIVASSRLRNSGANSAVDRVVVFVVPRLAAEAKRRLGEIG